MVVDAKWFGSRMHECELHLTAPLCMPLRGSRSSEGEEGQSQGQDEHEEDNGADENTHQDRDDRARSVARLWTRNNWSRYLAADSSFCPGLLDNDTQAAICRALDRFPLMTGVFHTVGAQSTGPYLVGCYFKINASTDLVVLQPWSLWTIDWPLLNSEYLISTNLGLELTPELIPPFDNSRERGEDEDHEVYHRTLELLASAAVGIKPLETLWIIDYQIQLQDGEQPELAQARRFEGRDGVVFVQVDYAAAECPWELCYEAKPGAGDMVGVGLFMEQLEKAVVVQAEKLRQEGVAVPNPRGLVGLLACVQLDM
ncbi:hypothetical protein B0T24DRAFT_640258 [Lasiosphaeria ovina]|uniref:Uncharacterized protein n=1 Tax=Lasiosphaeria ovina TaxID=92902 RepID=A0AAE0JUR0_9PEZI|nr:hypothetical protein B0T24DRAFT_640258 [Lasiosphaeria ovina]